MVPPWPLVSRVEWENREPAGSFSPAFSTRNGTPARPLATPKAGAKSTQYTVDAEFRWMLVLLVHHHL